MDIELDLLESEPFFPHTTVQFIERRAWSQRYVGNNLLWGEDRWIELKRGDTYMDWGDYLGPMPELDDIPF